MCFGLGELEIVENPGLPVRPTLRHHDASRTRVTLERRKTYPRAYETITMHPPHKRVDSRSLNAKDSLDRQVTAEAQQSSQESDREAAVLHEEPATLPMNSHRKLYGEVDDKSSYNRGANLATASSPVNNVIITINPTRYEREVIYPALPGGVQRRDADRGSKSSIVDTLNSVSSGSSSSKEAQQQQAYSPQIQPLLHSADHSNCRSTRLFGSLDIPSPPRVYTVERSGQDMRRRSCASSAELSQSSNEPRQSRSAKQSVIYNTGRRKRSFYYYD